MATSNYTPNPRGWGKHNPHINLVCPECGRAFEVCSYYYRHGNPAKKCPDCRRIKGVHERFWSKVEKTDSCWLWMGSRHPIGHGLIAVNGTRIYTHRLSWEMAYGPIPDGLRVCHHCDNPPCVRPDHLFVGTAKDNTQDALAKGRLPHGEQASTRGLTDASIVEIRRRVAAGEIHRVVAVDFGISRRMVGRICAKERWKHVA